MTLITGLLIGYVLGAGSVYGYSKRTELRTLWNDMRGLR